MIKSFVLFVGLFGALFTFVEWFKTSSTGEKINFLKISLFTVFLAAVVSIILSVFVIIF